MASLTQWAWTGADSGRQWRATVREVAKSQARLSKQPTTRLVLFHTVYLSPECRTSQTTNDGPGDYC